MRWSSVYAVARTSPMLPVLSARAARSAASASIALALLSPAVSRADEAEDRADRLFRQAQEKMAANEIDAACRLFAQSLEADRAIGTLLNLAVCHEKQGRLATAWSELVEVSNRA